MYITIYYDWFKLLNIKNVLNIQNVNKNCHSTFIILILNNLKFYF